MNIPNSTYEGYVWYSDQSEPKILRDENFSFEPDESKNPFIVEALLFDRQNSLSFSVKYVDGKYIINKTPVLPEDEGKREVEKKRFLASFGNGISLSFLHYWKPVKESNCEGMEMLLPEKLVFVGFSKNEEE